MLSRQKIIIVYALLLMVIAFLSSNPVFADSNQNRLTDRIVSKSDVLVVGRVESIVDGEKFDAVGDRWKLSVMRKHAVLEVYRAYPSMQDVPMTDGNKLSIDYLSRDDTGAFPMFFSSNQPLYPSVNIGDVYIFPMRRSSDDPKRLVVLDELKGRLIPCVKEHIPDSKTDTMLDFIYSEIAGTFAYGSYEDIQESISYLRMNALPDQLRSLIKSNVTGKSRWFDIAVVTYCTFLGGIPCPKITELDTFVWNSYSEPLGKFATMALRRAAPENLEEQFVRTIIHHADGTGWSAASAFIRNDQYASTVNRLLTDALSSDTNLNINIRLASNLISSKMLTETTIRASVEASKRLLKGAPLDWSDYSCVGQLIAKYGSDDDFRIIVDQLRSTSRLDMHGFDTLWYIATTSQPKRRMIMACKALIDNPSGYTSIRAQWTKPALPQPARYCDLAVITLQQATGEDFGFDVTQSEKSRDIAVKRAKVWLAAN
ncbi:MAG: hypothetical protein ACYC0V_01870 [Armatimonadota bacterium]